MSQTSATAEAACGGTPSSVSAESGTDVADRTRRVSSLDQAERHTGTDHAEADHSHTLHDGFLSLPLQGAPSR